MPVAALAAAAFAQSDEPCEVRVGFSPRHAVVTEDRWVLRHGPHTRLMADAGRRTKATGGSPAGDMKGFRE